MPTTVSIGLSKKAGLPDYGSIGASCHVELELDGQILDGDLTRFRQHVQHAYAACREAVEDELTRESDAPSSRSDPSPNGIGHGNGNHSPKGNGYRNSSKGNGRSSDGRGATQSQIRAIQAIANRGRIDLGPLLDRFGVRAPEDLGIGQASELIDELKAQSAGNGSSR